MKFGGRDTTTPRVNTRLDHLEGPVREHIRDELIPRMAEHTRISVDVDRREFHLYRKLRTGRRCSCWSAVNQNADRDCVLCYGTGVPGGFKKFGCQHHVFDVTAPNAIAVGVFPDFDSQARPVPFTLLSNCVRGRLEWIWRLDPNTGVLDAAVLEAYVPDGAGVYFEVRRQSESDYVEVTRTSLEARLLDTNGRPETLHFRTTLWRTSPDVALPKMVGVLLRYQTREDLEIHADVPIREESITLAELGLYESFQTIDMVLPADKVRGISTEDMLRRTSDGARFKVVSVNAFTPAGFTVHWNLQCRHVQRYEALSLVP